MNRPAARSHLEHNTCQRNRCDMATEDTNDQLRWRRCFIGAASHNRAQTLRNMGPATNGVNAARASRLGGRDLRAHAEPPCATNTPSRGNRNPHTTRWRSKRRRPHERAHCLPRESPLRRPKEVSSHNMREHCFPWAQARAPVLACHFRHPAFLKGS